jgi:hypothetical protein
MWRDAKVRDPFTEYIVIEKSTGNYLDMDNIVDAAFVSGYNENLAEPSIRTGHCSKQ